MSSSSRPTRRAWARLLIGAGALLALLLPAAPAAAHASLVDSQPPNGATLARAPAVAELRFNEDISARFSSATLLDGTGRTVPGTRVERDDARRLTLALPGLRPGPYGISWRVLAEDDGHYTSGVVVFSVGAGAQQADAAVLADTAGGTTAPSDVARRWLGLCLLAVLIGGLAVAGAVLRLRSAGAGTAAVLADARRRVLTLAAAAGVLAAIVGAADLVAEARRSAATGMWAPVAADLLAHTRWGHLWLGREAVLLALAVLAWALRFEAATTRRRDLTIWTAAGVLAAAAVTAEALRSHAMAVESARAGAVAAVAVHTLAACLWLGGVTTLAVVLVETRHTPGREALLDAARRRFTALAAGSVGLVVATGLYSAGRQIGSAPALTGTPYGRTLLIKSALLLVVGGLGLVNAVRLQRRTAVPEARPLLITMEAAAAGVLLVMAALLVETPPARDTAAPETGESAVITRAGSIADLTVTVTVTPNRPGINGFTVLAASSRRPPPAPIDGVTLDLGGGAESVALRETEPGRYFGTGTIAGPGEVRATVVVHRGRARLAVPLAWSTPPALIAAPARDRLAPIADILAVILLAAMAAVGIRWAAARRRRHAIPAPPPEIELRIPEDVR